MTKEISAKEAVRALEKLGIAPERLRGIEEDIPRLESAQRLFLKRQLKVMQNRIRSFTKLHRKNGQWDSPKALQHAIMLGKQYGKMKSHLFRIAPRTSRKQFEEFDSEG